MSVPSTLVGNTSMVVELNQAFNNNALSLYTYNAELSLANTASTSAIIDLYNQQYSTTTNYSALATTVLNNLSINTITVESTNYIALQTAVTQLFQLNPTAIGQVVNNLIRALKALPTDPTYGSAATEFNAHVAADLVQTNFVKNILIDLRTDPSAGTVDINGVTINSSAQINPLLDHLKTVGYNTVTFNLDVGIDMNTGKLDLTPSPAGLGLNTLPSASLWQDVAYAHSIGLSVNILAVPTVIYNADGTPNFSDSPISSGTPLAAGVNIDTVFKNIVSYETTLAKLAQQNHVETFDIGQNNYGYDSATYAPLWQQVITAVRSVYTGTIAYQACYDNAVFGLVDQINFVPNPVVSTTPIYNLAQIVEGYYHTPVWTNGPTYFQEIATMIKEYGATPIVLDAFQAQASNVGIGNVTYSFSTLVDKGADALATIPKPNHTEQALAFEAFLYVAQHLMGTQVAGVGFDGYNPWAQAAWLQNPGTNVTGQIWNLMNQDSNNLWGDSTAETAITQSFITNLLPNYFFSTPGNDTVVGNTGAVNTAVFYANSTASSITKTSTGLTVATPTDGADKLTNIQRIEFSDTMIAFDSAPGQVAGEAYRLYTAALGRVPDTGGLGFWISALDHGESLHDVSNAFVNSPEFHNNFYGDGSNAAFVTALYNNVLHRAPDPGGYNFWVNSLNQGADRASTLINFSESPENVAQTVGLVGQGIHYDQWLG